MVFADQAVAHLFALDPGDDADNVAGLARRRILARPPVRPMPVIVPGVPFWLLSPVPTAAWTTADAVRNF